MTKGARAEFERLLQSASDRQVILRAKEGSASDASMPKRIKDIPLNLGDSIGLLALLVAVIMVVITPPFSLKIVLLSASAIGCFIFFRKSHWTYVLSPKYQFGLATVVVFVLAYIAVPQLIAQWRSEHKRAEAPPVSPRLSFSITPNVVSNGEIPYGLETWLVREPNVMFPVGIEMFLELRSNTFANTTIDSIKFDVDTSHGWEELPIMEGGLLYGGSPRKMWRINMPLLEDAIRGKSFNNDAVSGWVLLDYPKYIDIKPDWKTMKSYLPDIDPEVGDTFVLSSGYWPWVSVSDMLPQFRARIVDKQSNACKAFFTIPTNQKGWNDNKEQEIVTSVPSNRSNTPIQLFKDTWAPTPPN